MWPWEHLAVGYLCFSAYTRARYGRPPRRAPAVALALTTQLPDLIDKPLAWSLSILPSGGFSLGHSVFFATAVVLLAGVLAHRRGAPRIGAAVAIGYASHLLGDVAYYVLRGGSVDVGIFLWPLVERAPSSRAGLFEETARMFAEFSGFLLTPRGLSYLLFEIALLGGVFALWAVDGWPGLRST